MKKAFLLTAVAVSLMAFSAGATESMTGKVVSKKADQVIIQGQDGKRINARIVPTTSYREKKVLTKDKTKDGVTYKAGSAYYKSPIEEDDWVEIYYVPSKGDMSEYELDEVVVLDD